MCQKICDVEKGLPTSKPLFIFYLFTYFVASSREKLNFSITFSIIASLEMPNSSSEDTKIFMELILSSATAFSITSHLNVLLLFCFRNLFYVKRYELEKGLLNGRPSTLTLLRWFFLLRYLSGKL